MREHAPDRQTTSQASNQQFPKAHNNKQTSRPIAVQQPNSPFSYLNVHVNDMRTDIMALVDTGSSINVIQRSTLHDLGGPRPSVTKPFSVTMANDTVMTVTGVVQLQISSSTRTTRESFYVFESTSHPLILGVEFLRKHNVTFDWLTSNAPEHEVSPVRCTEAAVLKPGEETLVSGKLPFKMTIGVQGVSLPGKHVTRKGVMCARGVLTKHVHGRVPVKLYNPHKVSVTINKGDVISSFQPFDRNNRLYPNSISSLSPDTGTSYESPASFVRINDIKVNDKLSPKEKQDINILLFNFRDSFLTKDNPEMGLCSNVKMKINLKAEAKPKYHRPYKLSPEKKEVLKYQLEHLLEQGIIRQLNRDDDTPIVSPVVLVEKRGVSFSKDDSVKERALSQFRFVVDFRYLNQQITDFKYAIPDMTELTDSFASAKPKFISKLDLSSSFHQIQIDEDSQKYTAFSTPFQTYAYTRVPMGLKVSPNTFQMCMDKILSTSNLSYKSLCCYIDDILLYHEDFNSHLNDLNELLTCLSNAGLKLNPKKCVFAVDEVIFLGNKISQNGIQPPKDKLEAVKNYPKPTNAKELKRFISFMSWFRKFIKNFSQIAFPLNELLKKSAKFIWNKECDVAFVALKNNLLNSEVLSYPRSDVDYIIRVDASKKGIGYMLYYLLPENESKGLSEIERHRVIKFGSKTLKSYQRHYGPCKLECLGITTAVTDLADYIRGRRVKVLCDHEAIKPLLAKQCRGAIFTRWSTIWQQFDIDVQYMQASDMVVPDALSRCHTKSRPELEVKTTEEDTDPFFPYVNEKPTTQTVGPSNLDLNNLIQPTTSGDEPEHINCIASVPLTNRFAPLYNDIDHYDGDDSDTSSMSNDDQIVSSISAAKSRRKHNRLCAKAVKPNGHQCNAIDTDTVKSYQTSHPVRVPTHTNSAKGNDQTSNRDGSITSESSVGGTDARNKTVRQQFENQLKSINELESSKLTPNKIEELQALDPDISPMIKYLSTGELPKLQRASRLLLVKSADYILVDGVLFHKEPNKRHSNVFSDYKLVVPKVMQRQIIEMYHDSTIGAHSGIQITIEKVRCDYFFERMCTIITDYVKSCESCQKRKIHRHTKSPVTALPSPQKPFEAWEIDLFGELPKTSQGNCHVFVATDMFSRYTYAVPIKSKDAITVSHALFNLCCTYGTPRTIYTDLGSENIALVTSSLCELLSVPQHFAPAFCHFVLGRNERTHLDMARRLTPFIEKEKDWDKFLNPIIFSMNSSVNSTIGFSPFEVVYSMKPLFPLSAPIEIFDISATPTDYRKYLRGKHEMIETIRDQVKMNTEIAQAEMLKKANATIHPLNVEKDDYVFLASNHSIIGSKLTNRYEGPFIIHEINSPHMVTIRDPTTNKLKNNIHLNRLKPAHIRIPDPTYAGTRPDLFPPLSVRKKGAPVIANNNKADQISKKQLNPDPVRPPRKSDRLRNKPTVNFRIPSSSESDTQHIKFLGQRQLSDETEYLVYNNGEPAEHSFWVTFSKLDRKAKYRAINFPPPILS